MTTQPSSARDQRAATDAAIQRAADAAGIRRIFGVEPSEDRSGLLAPDPNATQDDHDEEAMFPGVYAPLLPDQPRVRPSSAPNCRTTRREWDCAARPGRLPGPDLADARGIMNVGGPGGPGGASA
jgi:hypothetical protein